jgi:NAD+ diphosphatase
MNALFIERQSAILLWLRHPRIPFAETAPIPDARIVAMKNTYESGVAPPARSGEPVLWFAFQKSELLLVRSDDGIQLPHCHDLAELGLSSVRSVYLGTYSERHCYVAELAHTETPPAGHELQGLRSVLGGPDPALGTLAGRAFQIMEWDRNHQYCGRCGTPTQVRLDERSRVCPSCRMTSYPPVSPAIMILIVRGREILLARKKDWPQGRYSALAGFVEPGEQLEDTVHRETMEEVGLQIKNLRYFGSQPWPFPHQLMIAFTAEYAAGEITPDGVEIEEAAFFDVDNLPNLPAGISISRRMIDTVAKKLANGETL